MPTSLDSLPDDLILLIADKCAEACAGEDPAVLGRLACVCRGIRALLLEEASGALWLSALSAAARRGDRRPIAAASPHASLVPVTSWWRVGQSNRATYLALVQRLAQAPALEPPFSSPEAAAVAAAWAAKTVEHVIEAQVAFDDYKRLYRDCITRVELLRDSAGTTLRLFEAARAAAEASCVAAAVAERARDGDAATVALPPVSEDVIEAIRALRNGMSTDVWTARGSSCEDVKTAIRAFCDTLRKPPPPDGDALTPAPSAKIEATAAGGT